MISASNVTIESIPSSCANLEASSLTLSISVSSWCFLVAISSSFKDSRETLALLSIVGIDSKLSLPTGARNDSNGLLENNIRTLSNSSKLLAICFILTSRFLSTTNLSLRVDSIASISFLVLAILSCTVYWNLWLQLGQVTICSWLLRSKSARVFLSKPYLPLSVSNSVLRVSNLSLKLSKDSLDKCSLLEGSNRVVR